MGTKASSSTSGCVDSNDRKVAALFGMFVGDAAAMPVHWMYNLDQLRSDYGTITKFVKPKDRFEGSIMNLSNTGGGGRGSDSGNIIGDVINHGKKQYWCRGGNFHYHLGLDAGENTLEAQLTRLLMNGVASRGTFDQLAWLEDYIKFMTTPGSHNDTYASTCHRMFFANYVAGVQPVDCADNDGHNTDAIDALTNAVPVIVYYADAPKSERDRKVWEAISSTRRSSALRAYAESYSDLLVAVIHGKQLRVAIEETYGHSTRYRVERSASDPMVACYIDSAYPAMLFFAYKYADSFECGVLASANAGGENVARGSLLGALLGAVHGTAAMPAWTEELKHAEAIKEEIMSLIALQHSEE